MKKEHKGFVADPHHPCAVISVGFMLLSAVFRCIYYPGAGLDIWGLLLYLILPVAAAVVFAAAILLKSSETLLPTCISVVGGVLFFYLKAFTFAHWWHTLLCCILYTAVLLLKRGCAIQRRLTRSKLTPRSNLNRTNLCGQHKKPPYAGI